MLLYLKLTLFHAKVVFVIITQTLEALCSVNKPVYPRARSPWNLGLSNKTFELEWEVWNFSMSKVIIWKSEQVVYGFSIYVLVFMLIYSLVAHKLLVRFWQMTSWYQMIRLVGPVTSVIILYDGKAKCHALFVQKVVLRLELTFYSYFHLNQYSRYKYAYLSIRETSDS